MSKPMKTNEARILIRSHKMFLPRYDLNMTLSKSDAMKVMALVLELKAKS